MLENNASNNAFLWSKIKSLLGTTIATIGCFYFCMLAYQMFKTSFYHAQPESYAYQGMALGAFLIAVPFFLGGVKSFLSLLGKQR
ncbi:hypothetical protein [Photobacterium galatheae]|uniref:Uncharacterized protein n=1 Tax=Photobacterium galatheae TaxID=1654360 RepID=A0A066RPS6_9GAMM|nr:hypothetical protein [Photobacterium galatheae]KDM92470.1 hypothetical protein EA58_05885 [Photobacterium galatheae]MCM0147949.1 hypothetical protein [Photobacterium galatheae]